MNRGTVTSIFFLCTLFEAGAQPNVALLSQKFDAYQSTWPRTRLHLIFNQDKFSPGDTAWFKAYFLTENLTGVAGKQLIDLNLVDSRGESKLHFMFNVNNGLGFNQLALPDTLSAGIYLVTAYSNWMKNFDPAFIFKKKIVIVRKNALVPDEKVVLSVVAEGGHLIRGISNRVSIHTWRAGSSVQIMDAEGREILRTTTDANGLASGIFTPIRTSYFVQMTGDPGRTPLPATEDDGCSMRLIPAQREEPVKILVASPPASALRPQELIIMVSTRGRIYHTATFIQGNKEFAALQIPQADLPEGIAHVSLLNHAGDLLAGRDFYSPGKGPVQAKVQAAKNYFQAREKVKLEVSLTDSKGQPVEGEFAISVLNAGLLDVEKQNSLSDELNILSAAKLDRFLVDRTDPNWLTSLDNYLISVTEDVSWREIISKKAMKPRYDFTNVVQKNGRAYFAGTREPVPDFTDILFYIQRRKMRYQTTVQNGRVWLAIPDLVGQDELFYLAETSFYLGGTKHGKEIPNLKMVWEDDLIKLPRAPASMETGSPDRYASFVAKSRLIDRSYGFYTSPEGTGSITNSVTGSRDWEDEITGADITINVQDYTLFPTMSELVKEVIPSLQHRKTKQKSVVRVTLPEIMWATATGDPVYIIDGIATKNTSFFLSLKPSDVLTVKIVYRPDKLFPLGLMGKNGIVIVQTRKGDAREPLDDPSKLIEGLNKSVNFKARSHDSGGSDHSGDRNLRRPDFRSTVHWNPSVKTDSNGKATVEFFCSDDIGKLSIRIDGLATGGRPFTGGLELEVMADPEKN
jgi:hypothetical protein